MSDRSCELRTANLTDRITLRAVRINAHLVGMSARTVVEQLFVNEEDKAVEAVYTFPLPSEGAVCAFEIVIADRVLTGQVDEREQAIKTYEDAINQGNGAFLLEQEREDIFTVRVGNLLPKQAALVRLTYVQPLDVIDSTIRFALPTTVSPRYVTATGSDPEQMTIDADAINPPHVLAVPYGLTLAVHVDLGRKLKSIASPSHAIHTDFNDNDQYKITFAGGMSEMNRDVVIELKLDRELQPAVQVGMGPDGAKYLAVSFLPEFEERDLGERQAQEVIFVLDCSGSMGGESIQQAKAALELCLRSLNLGDRFNICCFGDSHELMSPEPLVYSDHTLKKAMFYVHRIDANLGGTELYAPLEAVLKTPTKTVRQVIVLSDGEISNEAAVMKLVRNHKDRNRIFAFGIGSSPSASLIRGLARSSGGAAEFISRGENIADKVLRTFSRLESPALHDVEIDFDLAEVTLATPHMPPVFDGDMLTVYARVVGYVPKTITLKATSAAGEQRWTASVASPRGDEPAIATTWARRMIQTLEEEPETNRSRLLELSRRFGLVCSLTAFVAVEHRSIEERNDGKPALRRIPVQLASGWHGIDALHDCLGAAPAAACLDRSIDFDICAAPAQAKRARGGIFGRMFKSRADNAAIETKNEAARSSMPMGGYPRSAAPAKPTFASPLQHLLSLQSAEGWFDLTSAEKSVADLYAERVRTGRFKVTPNFDWRAHATRFVLELLQTQYPADEPIWRAAFEKALRYLAKATGQGTDEVRKLIDEAAAGT